MSDPMLPLASITSMTFLTSFGLTRSSMKAFERLDIRINDAYRMGLQ